jgi:hypothetical protein
LLTNFYESALLTQNSCEKQIENLVLPRSKSENYLPNDRHIDYTNIYALLNNKEYVSYDTQETDNFREQIALLQKSKNIFVYWGSAFVVNGFFSKDSNIHLEMSSSDFGCPFILSQIILSIIGKNNKIVFI